MIGAALTFASLAAAALVLVYTAAATPDRRSTSAVADPALGGGPGCDPVRSRQLVRGNGTGSTATGPDTILAFQHAYYVSRSGAKARALATPDAAVSPIELIEAGINTIPQGSGHCVLITPLLDGRFDVVITEIRPDKTIRTYRQFVTCATSADSVLITEIAPPS